MKKKLFEFLPLFLFAVIGILYYQFPIDEATGTTRYESDFGNAFVPRVVDGDTVVAEIDGMSGEYKIRLLGVDTPESVDPRRPVQCFGKEATGYLKDLIEGRRVELVSDPEADERDKYGRLLRNIVAEDGVDVNAAIVEAGYGFAYTSFPQNEARKAELLRLEREAREGERGLWYPEACGAEYIDR